MKNCRVKIGGRVRAGALASLLAAGALALACVGAARAVGESLCAQVKIEIDQKLTLERQAFDAHMRIHNGLPNIALESVDIDVTFADGDGNPVVATSNSANTNALFFISLDTQENISDVSGAGRVEPQTTADVHWLIVPAPGAGGQNALGTKYLVGAKLAYRMGGVEQVVDVMPDYIFVKPMPILQLDYFLPHDIYADDAFTDPIEPPVPFSLGVRVRNTGFGAARELKIDSGQPKIG